MKQGNLILRVIMLVFFFGVLAYFGVYIWNSLTAEKATFTLYEYTAEERFESKGYFFRDETVLEERSDLAEIICAEGERVGYGDPVARIYFSRDGYAIQRELDEAKEELAGLKYILSRSGDSSDTVELDQTIVDTFTRLRSAAAAGELDGLDTRTDELRSLIFRRDYTYNGSDALTNQIAQAQARVNTLTAQASSAYENVTAPAAGLYSAVMDGYEGILTVQALEGLTPEGLTALAGRQAAVEEGGLGKIITNAGWYFVCNLSASAVGKVSTGETVALRFADSGRLFDAKVERISEEENGMVTVIFHSREYAAQLTGLRNQSVEIITDQTVGFRVPKRAVRVDESGRLGLYRVSGAKAEWVSIDILWEEADYYLVAQAPKRDSEGNVLEMTALEKAARLRAGDEIVVKGEGLYDGRVVED